MKYSSILAGIRAVRRGGPGDVSLITYVTPGAASLSPQRRVFLPLFFWEKKIIFAEADFGPQSLENNETPPPNRPHLPPPTPKDGG